MKLIIFAFNLWFIYYISFNKVIIKSPRSSCSQKFNKVCALKNVQKTWLETNLSKIKHQHICFPEQLFRNMFQTEHLQQLLLVILKKLLIFSKDNSFFLILFILHIIPKYIYLIEIIIKFTKIFNRIYSSISSKACHKTYCIWSSKHSSFV